MSETPFIERLQERTGRVRQAVRGPVYNHPRLWYVKPDGDIVQLQGSPTERAYYEDKGLSVLRPDEVREWLGTVRPQVIAEIREKAQLITTIRRISDRYQGVEVVADLDDLTVLELKELLDEVGRQVGTPVKVIRGPTRDLQDEPEDLDSTSSGSGEELEHLVARSQADTPRRRTSAVTP